MNDRNIYQNINQWCNGNTIHSLVTFSRVVPIHAITITTEYKLLDCPFNSIQETAEVIIHYHI